MGLKLKQVVTWVADTEGILFRMGESFLPLEGKRLGDYLQRLLPYFDGNWSATQLCSTLSEQHKEIVLKLIKALEDAGMLYDTSRDISMDLPESQSESIARIEAQNPAPVRLLSEAVRTRLLVLGNSQMTGAIAAAAIQLGLASVTVMAGEADAGASDERNGLSPLIAHLLFHANFDWSDIKDRFDAVFLAGDIDRDWDQIDAALSLLPDVPLLPFLICGSRVIAGPVGGTRNTVCVRCLALYYRQRLAPSAPPSSSRKDAGIRIGGRLLVQRWMDWKTGAIPADEGWLFSELNLDGLEVSLGPLLPNCTCTHSMHESFIRDVALPGHLLPQPPENWQDAFWAFAGKFLIHPLTGHIAQVTEGSLLQLPYNQSSAEWHLPNGNRKAWSTEVGDNIRDARVRVIQLALEEFFSLAEGIAVSPSDAEPANTHRADGIGRNSSARLIVSGVLQPDFEAQAFFRALSLLADHTGMWSEAAADLDKLKEYAIPLIGYLEDTSVFAHVHIQRHVEFSTEGAEVLRFFFRNKPISIVAGPAGAHVWVQGLKDIWLHITAQEDLPRPADIIPRIRYRCSEASPELLSLMMHELCNVLQLDFDLRILFGRDISWMKPLVFADASVSCRRSLADDRYTERSKAVGQLGQAMKQERR
jgi:hypothetical protein